MNNYDVVRFGLLLAIRVEVDGMIAENTWRVMMNQPITYSDSDFQAKAEELRNISHCHNEQL